MKHILCISHKYPPIIGGMEKQSYELVKGLGNHFHTHQLTFHGQENKLKWFALLPLRVKKLLKENPEIELIHLNDGSMGVASLWLQKMTRKPVFLTFHGLDVTAPIPFFQKVLIPSLRKFDGFICVSEATREECLKRGFAPEKTFVVNNGVDSQLKDFPSDYGETAKYLKENYQIDIYNKKILITLGRPVKRKGFSWFLKEVMPYLDGNIELLMVGPMKKFSPLQQKAWNLFPKLWRKRLTLLLGLPSDAEDVEKLVAKFPNVHHLGPIPFERLMETLSAADLFVMPNIKVEGDMEGFGLVALEASIRGTYIVASGIEGIRDAVISGKNGILLPSENPKAWIDTIHQLLSDKEKLERLSQEGKDFSIEHYSWEKMVNGYAEIFKKKIG